MLVAQTGKAETSVLATARAVENAPDVDSGARWTLAAHAVEYIKGK